MEKRAEQEQLMTAGLTWREAYGLISEAVTPRYTIWWRFELADTRRLKEAGIAGL